MHGGLSARNYIPITALNGKIKGNRFSWNFKCSHQLYIAVPHKTKSLMDFGKAFERMWNPKTSSLYIPKSIQV